MYVDLVHTLLSKTRIKMDYYRPDDRAGHQIKSLWLDLLNVYGRQGILPLSELQQDDRKGAICLSWRPELAAFIRAHPDSLISSIEGNLYDFWMGDRLSIVQELAILDRMLGALSAIAKGHVPRHNSEIHGFLHIAVSRIPFWDGLAFDAPQSLQDLYHSIGVRTSSGIYRSVVLNLRNNLDRLRVGIGMCIQQGRLEDAYAVGFHGVTLLYHWYTIGLLDQAARGKLQKNTPIHAFHHELWKLTSGMSTKQRC